MGRKRTMVDEAVVGSLSTTSVDDNTNNMASAGPQSQPPPVAGHRNQLWQLLQKQQGMPLSNLQQQAIELYELEQYTSCEILIRLDLSKQQCQNQQRQRDQQQNYIHIHLLAECSFQQKQWKTAKEYYETLYIVDDITYRYKVAKCCEQMKSCLIEAVCVLEVIPVEKRTLQIHMLLGKLYNMASRKHDAIQSYVNALKLNPMVIEAVQQLAKHMSSGSGGSGGDHINHALESASSSNNNSQNVLLVKEWGLLLTAQYRHQHSMALNLVQKLNSEYPNNIHLLLITAELYNQQITTTTNHHDNNNTDNNNNREMALSTYTKIRQLEPNLLQGMDQYGHLLGQCGKLHELSDLTDSLLAINDKSPIAWTCLSLHHKYNRRHRDNKEVDSDDDDDDEDDEIHHNIGIALKFVEKAIALDQKHAFAHYIRGKILLDDHRPEYAAVSFFRSNEISPKIATYEGLVDAYLAASKDKEAIAAAKEAWTLAPRDPRTLTLVGLALSQAGSASSQAKRSLSMALQMCPALSRPLYGMIELLKHEKDYKACIQILNQALQASEQQQQQQENPNQNNLHHHHSENSIARMDEILCLLGDVYTVLEDSNTSNHQNYKQAIEYYNRALAIQPHCRKASQALDRLDKLMRGLDPNENSEEIVEDASPSQESPDSRPSY